MTNSAIQAGVPLYRQVLGADFEQLPPVVRRLHSASSRLSAAGQCSVRRGPSPLVNWLADRLGLPKAGEAVALRFELQVENGRERWTRYFANGAMSSVLCQRDGRLYEKLGLVTFEFALEGHREGLAMHLRKLSAFGIPLPRWVYPEVWAREREEGGRFLFDVGANLPYFGLLVHYRGFLELDEGAS